MRIVEYNEEYKENVKDLLVELQQYLVDIDYFHYLKMKPRYREEMFKLDMEIVKDNEGKIYLAIEDNKVLGLIMGSVIERELEDELTNTCEKAGEINELITTKDSRGKGIGKCLLNKIESYFKNIDCKKISIEVYGPNKNALNFYTKNGYEIIEYYVTKRIN